MSSEDSAESTRGNGASSTADSGNGWLEGLSSESLNFVEDMFAAYHRDPQAVSPEWRHYFAGLANGRGKNVRVDREPSFARFSIFNPPSTPGRTVDGLSNSAIRQERVDQLIRNYRVRGHIAANLDPLRQPAAHPRELEPSYYGFTEEDLDRPFSTVSARGPDRRTLREINQWMRNTYCRSVGAQFMHIDDLDVREWLQDRMEGSENRIKLSRAEQLRILRRLTDAVIFEGFLQKKYIGAKSFSLEGAESLIPLLDLAIESAAEHGVEEIVLGMAHRGRLNVLANIVGKSPREIFREFEDVDPELHTGRGDVKYHLGYSSDWTTQTGKKVHLSLCFNPSHLEFVNTVAIGRIRAKQDRFRDGEHRRGMALLIHGDAAFAGEGIVQETLNLSELDGYTIGGTIHIVVNNQVGFTTSPREGRSSVYATDVAKMLQIPIFHVNGEDPEAVAQVVRLALDFRKKFQRDVVIDMYCYRLRGHNEGDEPSFTQPVMYRAIAARKSVREGYLSHLLKLNEITREEADKISDECQQRLEQELATARSKEYKPKFSMMAGVWREYTGGDYKESDDINTGVEAETLRALLLSQSKVPEDFHMHPKIERAMERRVGMASGEVPLDWASAEALAFATLATEGHRVRLSGQDVQRGTFSQRHAVLHDYQDGHTYVPLQHLADDQAPVELHNSPLSEAGVLGFEYGYSLDCPEGLVIWEAQFGDFVNAAQVIIDQFIVSAEDKWRRLSGLVMLLPHGFEGQGPEHSSARLERVLTLAAEDNIQIANPTTPAQYYHLLRRQALRRWRKPLFVMTPKSLLRNPSAVSPIDECARGRFQTVLPETEKLAKVERVLLCSGKISYELIERRAKLGRNDVAILRMEQLYPLPSDALRAALAKVPDRTPVVWVQEEPENMGAWRFIKWNFGDTLFGRLPFTGVSRPASASPATGSATSHRLEQEEIFKAAFRK